MSALLGILALALLFALFGALAVLGGRVRECHGCDVGDPARCGSCPLHENETSEEVEIR